MVRVSNSNNPKSNYYAYFHSIIKYGFFLGGGGGFSSSSGKFFTLQKKIFRIMTCAQLGASCRILFSQLEVLPFPHQHVYSLMSCFTNSQETFQTNSSIHNMSTRNRHHHLHQQNANQSFSQTSTFYAGIKIFNSLPPNVTILRNDKTKCFLKSAVLRKYLHTHSVYFVDDFSCVKMTHDIFVKSLHNFTL